MCPRRFASPVFALLVLFSLGLFVAPAADACRDNPTLPKSASTDGALARFVEATKDMSFGQLNRYAKSLPEAERQQLRSEVQALPENERAAFTKSMRRSPKQTKRGKKASHQH